MRIGNKRKPDYEAISRRSIKKDFYPERIYLTQKKTPETRKKPEINFPKETPDDVHRIIAISPACPYAKWARYFVGKLVRLVQARGMGDSTTGWYEFVHDDDRVALNAAAGWSDSKKQYLLERPKFKQSR